MPAPLVKLETAPDLVDQVYRALHDAISAGTLAPGERIVQEDLAQQFAVSRQPVLQALRLLKQDGLVRDAPGRGLQVAPLEGAAIAQVYQVRGALDALAARLAAARGQAIAPALIEQGRAAAAGRDVGAMVDADLAFHRAIYAASGNALIERSAQLHWSHVRRVMGATLQRATVRDSVWNEHAAVADAIAAGDAPLAERLMQQHCEQAAADLDRRLAAAVPSPWPSPSPGRGARR